MVALSHQPCLVTVFEKSATKTKQNGGDVIILVIGDVSEITPKKAC